MATTTTPARNATLSHVLDAFDYAGSVKIKLVNLSLTSGNATAAMQNAVARFGGTGGLVINSAGNNGGANPDEAGNVTAANKDYWLFVGALNGALTSYTIATYSNMAGSMADRTVFAVGTNVTTLVDGKISTFWGTSSSAPVVSALGARILSKWPQLTGKDVGNIILNTARDIGAPGTDAVFGRGLVDFQAALSPVNPTTLSNGTSKTSLSSSYMAVPAGMDTTFLKAALGDVTILDEFGRDFTGSVAGMVVQAEDKWGHWLRRHVAQMDQGNGHPFMVGKVSGSFGYTSTKVGIDGQVRSALTTGEFAYKAGRTTFRAGVNAPESMQSDIMGLAPFSDGVLAYAPQAGNSFGADGWMLRGRLGLTLSGGKEGRGASQAAKLSYAGVAPRCGRRSSTRRARSCAQGQAPAGKQGEHRRSPARPNSYLRSIRDYYVWPGSNRLHGGADLGSINIARVRWGCSSGPSTREGDAACAIAIASRPTKPLSPRPSASPFPKT